MLARDRCRSIVHASIGDIDGPLSDWPHLSHHLQGQ